MVKVRGIFKDFSNGIRFDGEKSKEIIIPISLVAKK